MIKIDKSKVTKDVRKDLTWMTLAVIGNIYFVKLIKTEIFILIIGFVYLGLFLYMGYKQGYLK